MSSDSTIQKWIQSADAWICDQGTQGDWSRRAILDQAVGQILKDIRGKDILDLGCGEGRYCRVLQQRGANVTGVDPVPQFISHARSLDSVSTYMEGKAEELPFADNAFDVILSYLSIVDISDLETASQEIARVIRNQGQLVIATISNIASTTPSWVKDGDGKKAYRKVDRYMEHFAMDLEWRNIRIRNYHRPLSYVLGLFLNKGFALTEFDEPLPAPSDSNYQDEFRVPTFQVFKLVANGQNI